MTIDEGLRRIARHAEEHQRPITVEEIVAPASGRDAPESIEPSRPTPAWHRRRQWFLVAATVTPTRPEPSPTTHNLDRPIRNGWIAFAADAGAGAALSDRVDHQRVETVPEPMDIYLTRAGEPTRRLISGSAHERCPAFSPDGERLAYLSVRSGPPPASDPLTAPPLDASIVVLRVDGTGDTDDPELEVPLPASPGYGVRRDVGYPCPQWAPNGSGLAYLAHPAGDEGASDVAELRVLTLDGRERVVNAGAPADHRSSFAWSPTGHAIAFLRVSGVWAATLDGKAPTLAADTAGDGGVVVARRGAGGHRRGTAAQRRLRGPHRRHPHGNGDDVGGHDPNGGAASWSPDGSRLAFLRHDGRIVIIDRDRDTTVHLPPPRVDDHETALWDVGWSPKGDRLLALALYAPVLRAPARLRGSSRPGAAPTVDRRGPRRHPHTVDE